MIFKFLNLFLYLFLVELQIEKYFNLNNLNFNDYYLMNSIKRHALGLIFILMQN